MKKFILKLLLKKVDEPKEIQAILDWLETKIHLDKRSKIVETLTLPFIFAIIKRNFEALEKVYKEKHNL